VHRLETEATRTVHLRRLPRSVRLMRGQERYAMSLYIQ